MIFDSLYFPSYNASGSTSTHFSLLYNCIRTDDQNKKSMHNLYNFCWLLLCR